MHFAFYVLRVAISRPCPAGPLPVSSRAHMDSGGDMSGHRLSRLLAPSPRGRPYVLNSDAKVYYIFLIRKKIARNFQEIFDFVDTQLFTRGYFSGFSVVKRFNGFILYIGDLRPCRSPCRYRAGYQAVPDARSKTAPY